MRARGFLLGATAGRTTLNGEGLQHEDGHSQIQAQLIPNCRSYDPTFAYELAVIIQRGLTEMLDEQRDVFYYISVMNENYRHPAMPDGVGEDIIKGAYKLRTSELKKPKGRVRLLGSGTILTEALRAADMLENDFGIAADVYSATSFNMLTRDGRDCARWNLHHPGETEKTSHIAALLGGDDSPVVAATDYVKMFADQIREFVPARYVVLGTDGFGRSDTRWNLREHFEVSGRHIAAAALSALAADGKIDAKTAAKALKKYNIDAERENPLYL